MSSVQKKSMLEKRAEKADLETARKQGFTLRYGTCTDIGCVRDHNEDSLVASDPLFAVADGMGGHEAGEVASEIAVTQLAEFAPKTLDAGGLVDAVREANHEIIRASFDGRGREGMGTTLTAAMIEGENLIIAQVGDSRAYLLHDGVMHQVTRDHSLMADLIEAGQITPEEARYHPNRSMITRALGADPATTPDLYEITVQAEDRLLICSDGLSSMLEDPEIERTLRRVQDPQRCADELVAQALAAGGFDNVTVIVIDLVGQKARQHRKMTRKAIIKAVFIALLFIAVLAAAAFGCYKYTQTVAFLTEEDGYVAIYRGLPGSVAGISLNQLEETTEVKVSDLQPAIAGRLADGIRVDSLEDAQDLVASYEEEIQAEKDKIAQQEADKKKAEAERKAKEEAARSASGSSAAGSAGAGASSSSSGSVAQGAAGGTAQSGASQ